MDHLCEPCNRDSERQEAIGFCEDCDEYLCSGCCRAHRKMKVLQNHVIIDSLKPCERDPNEIRSHSPLLAHADAAFAKECLEHIGNTFEYFCTRCNVSACSECVSGGHKECNTVYIPDISCNFDMTRPDDKRTLSENIEAIRRGLADIEPKVRSQIADVTKMREDYAEGLDQLKKDAVATTEAVFKLINKLVGNIVEKDIKHCNALISQSKEAMDELNNQVNTKIMDGPVSHLPKAVKMANALLHILPETPNTGNPQCHLDSLESLRKLEDFIEAIYEVLSETKDIAIPESQLTNMSTETEDDTEQCQISAAIVTGTRLVIADRGNKKVKVFDTVKKELLAELKLPMPVWEQQSNFNDGVS